MNLYGRLLKLLVMLNLRPKVSFFDRTEMTFRVWPTDLDTAGHVNNAKYVAMLDLGRIDLWFRSGFWQKISTDGGFAVVSSQSIRYRRSLKAFEKFTLTSQVIGWDDKAFYYLHDFLVDGELSARAVVQSRAVRRGKGVPIEETLAVLGDDVPELELPEWVKEWAGTVRVGL
ncbi:thioesterase family protein [Nocardioides yefusunii]|uniref:Thioesterase family protein n=1 Tax=Nocardioides yefusunii TaxID=2500546 RepID=A0ABW1R483_9ACTN|nr:thioesterase family protein [Nocardioides yefusunii]